MKKLQNLKFEDLNGVGLITLAESLKNSGDIATESEIFSLMKKLSLAHGEHVANCKCHETLRMMHRKCDYCIETARKELAHVGEKSTVMTGISEGYDIRVPDPKQYECEECHSTNHWKFVGVESSSQFRNNFIWDCTNIYQDGFGVECECRGVIETKE